jgi:hypothetical protein
MSTTGAGAASAVLNLTKWSLEQKQDKQEVTSFGDLNKTYVVGLPDLTGELEGFWNSAEDKPFQASVSTDGVRLYLYPSADAPTKYWYGPAWVDFGIDTSVDDAVKISGSFSANGAWGRL